MSLSSSTLSSTSMHSLLSRKKTELRSALQSKNAHAVASALELPPVDGERLRQRSRQQQQQHRNGSSATASASSGSSLAVDGAEWGGVLAGWVDAAIAAGEGDVVRVYEAQSSLHSSLNHIFSSVSGNWLVPALHAACRNTHRSAVLADHFYAASTSSSSSGSGGGKNDHSRLQNAVTLLQESFSKTLNDRKEYRPDQPLSEDGSKRAGVLYIVNHLFAMYFRLNTLRLCKNLLRPVEAHNLHRSGAEGDMVTYRYYAGRLGMFEDSYEVAEQNLDYALRHCHKAAVRNKKRILNYLLPVKLLRGRLPTKKLLSKYGLTEFEPLVEGIRTGDLRTFNDGLRRHQDLFIRRGTYLLLEKCKTVCYRNLFKRVYIVLGRTQLPLDHVARSFKWLGMPIDLDEVECILANLIFRGYVRGYISHAKRVLVLSKKDPFPVAAVIAK